MGSRVSEVTRTSVKWVMKVLNYDYILSCFKSDKFLMLRMEINLINEEWPIRLIRHMVFEREWITQNRRNCLNHNKNVKHVELFGLNVYRSIDSVLVESKTWSLYDMFFVWIFYRVVKKIEFCVAKYVFCKKYTLNYLHTKLQEFVTFVAWYNIVVIMDAKKTPFAMKSYLCRRIILIY